MQSRHIFALGALLAALAVAAGAFGAHGLKKVLTAEQLSIFDTAVRYQGMHALALLAAAWSADRWPGKLPVAAAGLFSVGVLLFCGSLYLIVLFGVRGIGLLTPLGGLALIGGWLCLMLAALYGKKAA